MTSITALHPHLAEEIEFGRGPRLWDATPGVCCAAFQLGACAHTEAYDPDDDDFTAEDAAELAVQIDRIRREGGLPALNPGVPAADEPF